MNILVLSHMYPRPGNSSHGIFVHQQVKQLQKVGHRVIVLSPAPWSPWILHFNAKWRAYGSTPVRYREEDVEVYYPRYIRLPSAWFRAMAGFTYYKSILPLILKLHREYKFDIIHSHALLPDGLAGLYLGTELTLPTVCTVHGSDALIYPFENFLNKYYSKKVLLQTKQIIAVSYALREAIENFAKPVRAARIVYHGVDTDRFQPLENSVKNLPPKAVLNKPYILFVGKQIYVKGLKDLLNAFAQLVDKVDHNLVVVGPTLPEVVELAPELIESLKSRLIVTGLLPFDEIPAYMQNCDLFVLPSYSEGLPNVVLEAMACGKPVVATNVMGIPEQIIDGVTGFLIQPGDISGLAERIEVLLKDPARCYEMGEAGRKRVMEQFVWERSALELSLIYQKTIHNTAVDLQKPY